LQKRAWPLLAWLRVLSTIVDDIYYKYPAALRLTRTAFASYFALQALKNKAFLKLYFHQLKTRAD
jgi:hypothetical protein